MKYGHDSPLTLECLKYFHNISIAPIRVIEQETIDKHGNAITKLWMTHDQSFPGLSGLSVNSRLIVEEPPPPVCLDSASKGSCITSSV